MLTLYVLWKVDFNESKLLYSNLSDAYNILHWLAVGAMVGELVNSVKNRSRYTGSLVCVDI